MEEKTVQSLDQIVHEFRTQDGDTDSYIYRGQGNGKWPLEAGFDRGRTGVGAKMVEELYSQFFDQFKREYAFRYGEAHGEGDLALETTAQHYGLKTRLLDWSRSPFVGVFFAINSLVENGHRDNCAVFALNATKVFDNTLSGGLELLTDTARDNDRMRRQHGCLVRNRTNHTSIESYLDSIPNLDSNALIKYVINPTVALEIAAFLKLLRYNSEAMFGGLDAMTKDLNNGLL